MGRIFNLFDFNQASTSRKLLTHDRYVDGLEAPRNSLDLPLETSQSYHARHENIPYSYQVKPHPSMKGLYPRGAPMKLLIDQEMSKTDTKRIVPSIIARLMGMDMLPTDIKPMTHAKERKDDNSRNGLPREEQIQNGSTHNNLLASKPSKHPNQDFFPSRNKQEPDLFYSNLKSMKPQPREHPQEQQLQKFKKEFEAWQASKVWERSRCVELDSSPRQWRNNQTFALADINKGKMARYADARRNATNEKPMDPNGHSSPAIIKKSSHVQPRGDAKQGEKSNVFQQNLNEAISLRSRTRTSEFGQFSSMNYEDQLVRSSLPTRIVILKPGPEGVDDAEESQAGSAELVEEDGANIEDFLEEVKERLRISFQGNNRKDITITGSGVKSFHSERSTDPKEIARQIAKQVRESVSRDLGLSLQRSEMRSELQLERPGSPEFIKRDNRKFLSESLRNVPDDETGTGFAKLITCKSGTSILDYERERSTQIIDISRDGEMFCYSGNADNELETKTKSFRHEQKSEGKFDCGEVSPRNLIRSLSAPVSGTSFGKLLLEDQHVLTGAQIRRKHEANVSVEVRKTRKDRFNFRGKVSNLRYSFTLRSRLFGRKIQSAEETEAGSESVSSVEMNLGTTQENSTEVPPSPASVCSSTQEEFCRPGDHSSPISTLDVPFNEDLPVPEVFREINSNLQELRRQLNQLESKGSEVPPEPECLESEMVGLEGPEHIYIKDVLVAAGLFWSPSKWALTSDSPTKPIGNGVFEEVEAAYIRKDKESEGAVKDSRESKVEHKLLFDLLNEALTCLHGPFFSRASAKGGMLCPTIAPSGKKLLGDVWRMIRMHLHPPSDGFQRTLEGMVACDVGMDTWMGMMCHDIDVIGRDMERIIIGELVEEFMRDAYFLFV